MEGESVKFKLEWAILLCLFAMVVSVFAPPVFSLSIEGTHAVPTGNVIHGAADTEILSYPQQMQVGSSVTVGLRYKFNQYVPSGGKAIQVVTSLIRAGMGWQIIEAKNVTLSRWSSGAWYYHTASGTVPDLAPGDYSLYVLVWWVEYIGEETYVYYSYGDSKPVTVYAGSYTLAISVSPSGGGTTSPRPGTYTYAKGTKVGISATAATGYVFSRWGGDASGTSSYVGVIVDRNKSVTANFTYSPAPPPVYSADVSIVEISAVGGLAGLAGILLAWGRVRA